MKTIRNLAAIIIASLLPIIGTAQNNRKTITEEKLPKAVITTIKTHLGDSEIEKVIKRKGNIFEVYMTDKTEFVFSKKGKCLKIENKTDGIDESLVPEEILSIINETYPGEEILVNRMNIMENSCKLLLSNNKLIEFNKEFKITGQGFEEISYKDGKLFNMKSSFYIYSHPRDTITRE